MFTDVRTMPMEMLDVPLGIARDGFIEMRDKLERKRKLIRTHFMEKEEVTDVR